MTDAILQHREHGVLTLTFNRPERLNAFRREEYAALHRLLGELATDRELRVVVLTGAGRAFCAGEDLKELEADATAISFDAMRANVETLQDITRRIVQSDKVFVAAVNGVAAGFGAELAVACDCRVAAHNARFLFPEVRRGLFVTNGVTALLPRMVGHTWASTLLLSGEAVDAATAERAGLVTEAVADAELLTVVGAMARRMAENAPTAMRLTKRALAAAFEAELERALVQEVDDIMRVMASGEHVEGARAFIEKRPPRFGSSR